MVAFFAAQTIETTPEMPLPKGEKGAPKYGLFTFTHHVEARRKPAHDLSPARPRRAAAICGRYAPEADAAVRGRTRCARLRHRGRRIGAGMADDRQGRRSDASRRQAAPARRRHQARHHAAQRRRSRRRDRLCRGQVGQEPDQPRRGRRLEGQAGAQARRPAAKDLCAPGRGDGRLQAEGRAPGAGRRARGARLRSSTARSTRSLRIRRSASMSNWSSRAPRPTCGWR